MQLLDGEIKFRLNNDWAVNVGGADGILVDGGDNLVSTAGYYNITLDFNNNTYAIEAANVWGIVGSGYNDWAMMVLTFRLLKLTQVYLWLK